MTTGFLRVVAPPRSYLDAFEQGLRTRGYVPGTSIAIEYRFADGPEGDLDRRAKELVDRSVAVMLVAGNQAVRAAQRASTTVPIVMAAANDPVASGLVKSLVRPGGNVTGTTSVSSTLAARPARIAVLGSGTPDPMFLAMRTKIVALAARGGLPAIYNQREFVIVGGLMGCGPSIRHAYDRVARFADRTDGCVKPADLPGDQPSKFALTIGVATARLRAVTMPPSMTAPADSVVP
jgi:putative ABC transport system substrate-binding protein